MIVVTFEDFLKTYSLENQRNTKVYRKVMELARKGKRREEINRILHLPDYLTYNWLVKKQTPSPVKAIEVLKKFGLKLPLYTTKSEQFILFVKMLAFIFGDGAMTPKFSIYLTGNNHDLKILQNEVKHTFKLPSKIWKFKNPVSTSCSLDLQGKNNQILGRLLFVAGAPKGNKIVNQFIVPEWVMEGPKWIKKLFLEVLLGNELESPTLCKNKKGSFCVGGLRFSMSKDKRYLDSHRKFLEQIRLLLKEFDVETSELSKPQFTLKRKDGRLSYSLEFSISRDKINSARFLKSFKLRYANKKQKSCDEVNKVVREDLRKYLENVHLHQTVMKLRKLGLGSVKISKILGGGIPYQTIESWLILSRNPRYLNRKLELENSLK